MESKHNKLQVLMFKIARFMESMHIKENPRQRRKATRIRQGKQRRIVNTLQEVRYFKIFQKRRFLCLPLLALITKTVYTFKQTLILYSSQF